MMRCNEQLHAFELGAGLIQVQVLQVPALALWELLHCLLKAAGLEHLCAGKFSQARNHACRHHHHIVALPPESQEAPHSPQSPLASAGKSKRLFRLRSPVVGSPPSC